VLAVGLGILILGPGEAKTELEERLGHEGLGGRVVGIEAADKMTDRQVAARVRERFVKNGHKLQESGLKP
jgi:hypothetical protein